MRVTTVQRTTAAAEIVDRIQEMILAGLLHPGEKLPPERDLAQTLGVSRPVLREALRSLALMKIVEARQGDGTYITSLDAGLLAQPLEFMVAFGDRTALQVYEVRKILEVGIAQLAAQRITDGEIGELEELLERARQSFDQPRAFLDADIALHNLIIQASRNPILERIMASIRELALASRERTVLLPEIRKIAIRDHSAIVRALRARDPVKAQQVMLAHLRHAEEAVKALSDARPRRQAHTSHPKTRRRTRGA